jgi:hypothetical protein
MITAFTTQTTFTAFPLSRLKSLLNELDSLSLDTGKEGVNEVASVRSVDSGLVDDAVEDELGRDTGGDTDETSHRRRAGSGSNGRSVVEKSRGAGLLQSLKLARRERSVFPFLRP